MYGQQGAPTSIPWTFLSDLFWRQGSQLPLTLLLSPSKQNCKGNGKQFHKNREAVCVWLLLLPPNHGRGKAWSSQATTQAHSCAASSAGWRNLHEMGREFRVIGEFVDFTDDSDIKIVDIDDEEERA
ncbi:hypothetical protein FHG87_022281 [Trinorchestia longiramus]|nr:hypothetical protein FHG87_022281 [Trinorchestia longiramus]